MNRIVEFALVGVGSAVGGMARHAVSLLVAHRFPQTATDATAFPTATFLANVSGCFLIGLLAGILSFMQTKAAGNGGDATSLAAAALSPGSVRLLLGVGVLGGYTTFSTLMLDTVRLGAARGLGNFLASGAAGLTAVVLGQMLARLVSRA